MERVLSRRKSIRVASRSAVEIRREPGRRRVAQGRSRGTLPPLYDTSADGHSGKGLGLFWPLPDTIPRTHSLEARNDRLAFKKREPTPRTVEIRFDAIGLKGYDKASQHVAAKVRMGRRDWTCSTSGDPGAPAPR